MSAAQIDMLNAQREDHLTRIVQLKHSIDSWEDWINYQIDSDEAEYETARAEMRAVMILPLMEELFQLYGKIYTIDAQVKEIEKTSKLRRSPRLAQKNGRN